MYNRDYQTKPEISARTEKCEATSKKLKDVENQLMNLSDTISILEKMSSELTSRLEPVLAPGVGSGSDKDSVKEEELSPLASSIRDLFYRTISIKSKLDDIFQRIQL